MLSEIPSPEKERATQRLSSVHTEPGGKAESIVIPTRKDRLIVAVVSLVKLLFIACMAFGATSILHTGYIGWFAILAVILIAVITINLVMTLSSSHLKQLNERSRL